MNLDVIPWFSDKTNAISNENLVDEYRNNSALSDYVNIIEEVIELIQPKRIHLNGVPPRLVFESVFGIEFKPLKLIDKSIGMYVGHLIVRNVEYPVLAHNFGKTQSGPNSIVQWKSMADKYEAWDNS